MEALDIDRFVDKLREFDALRDADTVNRGCVDRIQPAFADAWPTILDPAVRDSLVSIGIPRPYHHQAEAIGRSLSGADVVMESPTASGKNLSFTAPMLHALMRYTIPMPDDSRIPGKDAEEMALNGSVLSIVKTKLVGLF